MYVSSDHQLLLYGMEACTYNKFDSYSIDLANSYVLLKQVAEIVINLIYI
jgi:hypothetical protein